MSTDPSTSPTASSNAGPQPSLRDRKKAETRDRIATAAAEKFIELGAEGATIAVIADAADISPRTFHNYFTRREDALLHFCVTYIEYAAEVINALPPEVGPLEALEKFILDSYNRSDDGIYSWSTVSLIGDHLKMHFKSIIEKRGRDPESRAQTIRDKCNDLPDGSQLLSPMVQALMSRSQGKMTSFQAFLMLGYSMAMADTVRDSTTLNDLFEGRSEQELLKEGFDTLRAGFRF